MIQGTSTRSPFFVAENDAAKAKFQNYVVTSDI